MAPVPLDTPLVFPRRMAAVDYLMFRGEHMPQARTAMLSVSLLDTVPDLDRLRAVYDRASRIVVRMRQHVVEPVVPLTSPQWVVDPDFDLTYHVRRVSLPGPGTVRQLLDFAQPLHAAPLDTARPLWEVYLVEGVNEGDARAALLLKMHHAISDGVGGIALAGEIYDSERDLDRGPLPPRPVPQDVSSTDLVRHALRRAPISITETLIRGTSRVVGTGIRVLRKPDRAANDVARFVGSARRVVGSPPVPPSPLLSRRGLGRRLEWHEFPFDRFRRAAKAVGGSVNDAYIAGLCGALRRYHDALGVPIESLPLALPVSLRSDDDPAAGNRFAGARIVAPIGEPDPAQRIALIREQVLDAVAEPAINAMQRGRAGVRAIAATDHRHDGIGRHRRRRPGEQRPRLSRSAVHRRREDAQDARVRSPPRRRDDGRHVHRGRRLLRRHPLRHRVDHRTGALHPLPARGLRRDPRARARTAGREPGRHPAEPQGPDAQRPEMTT